MNGNQQVHIILQGKGGCGKSTIASIVLQALQATYGDNGNVIGIDTDPVNATLTSYAALPVQRLEIIDQDRQIDSREFDRMIDIILNNDGPVLIDNGATSFVPITGYLAENGALDVLASLGREVFIHTILTGGQAFQDTLTGLQALLASTTAPIVVWENEFFGPVERDGRRFAESSIYERHRDRIAGIITLPRRNADFMRDHADMASQSHTYHQAINNPAASTMQRHRLNLVWQDLMAKLQPLLQKDAP